MCEHEIDIQAYHDGSLDENRRAQVESHLESCAACRELLADYQKIQRVIRGASLPEMTINASKAVRKAFLRAQDRSIRVMAEWLSVAAAAVLLFMLLNPISATPSKAQPGSPEEWEINAVMAASPIENQAERQVKFAQWVTNDLTLKNEGSEIKEP